MHASAAVFAIFVLAVGCAHRDPSAPAWKARVIRPRQDEAPSGRRAPAPPKAFSGPDAWFHREIAEREARIAALRQQVERAEGREDEQAEDVEGRLEQELELEKESLDEFQRASTTRYSGNMMGGGVALVFAGGFSLLGGVCVALAAWGPAYGGSSRHELQQDAKVAVPVVLSLAVSSLAVGLPMLVVGARKVPKPEPAARVWLRPGEVSVRGSF